MSIDIVFLEPDFVDSLLWADDILTDVIVPLLVGVLDENLALGVVVLRVFRDRHIACSCDRTPLKSPPCSGQSLFYKGNLVDSRISIAF